MKNNMEKYCLQWEEFGTNVREYFRELRRDERLSDVTLASNDGYQIRAHKVILSAGSQFFSDIFVKSDHNNMLIYLKGVSGAELRYIADFIYNGEASILQEELNKFLDTGNELKIKGLIGDVQGIPEPNETKEGNIVNKIEPEYVNEKGMMDQSIENFSFNSSPEKKKDTVDNDKKIDESFSNTKSTTELVELKTEKNLIKSELDMQIQEMSEREEGMWRCKVCRHTAKTRQHINSHAETHLKGISHACDLCDRACPTRQSLKAHIFRNHSKKSL